MRSSAKKELRTDEEARSCDVCGRTILKGERIEIFLAPGGRRKNVCELCIPRAEHEGWIRESAAADMPAARTHRPPRRSFVGRIREAFAREENGTPAEVGEAVDQQPEPPAERPRPERPERQERPEREPAARRRDARHVRAVPTTAEVKVER